MRNRPALCLTALLGLGLGGCGTIQNLAAELHPNPLAGALVPSTPYGGVNKDLEYAAGSALGGGPFGVPLAAVSLLDVPFSAVGDTLTLPFVFYFNVRRYDDVVKMMEDLPKTCPGIPTPGEGVPAPPGP